MTTKDDLKAQAKDKYDLLTTQYEKDLEDLDKIMHWVIEQKLKLCKKYGEEIKPLLQIIYNQGFRIDEKVLRF